MIARVRQSDPKLLYRKELEQRAKAKQGRLSPVDRRALKFLAEQLGVSRQEAEQIEKEVLQPYETFWYKLQEFGQAVKEVLEYDPEFSASSRNDLLYLQQTLKLRDEDIAPLFEAHRLKLRPPIRASLSVISPSLTSEENEPEELSVPTELEDALSSERSIDYMKLRDLLKAGDWKAADQETWDLMITVVKKGELLSFPCKELQAINELWVKYSEGQFGFSVQKQIYVECGVTPKNEYFSDQVWYEFCKRVGWLVEDHYLSYEESIFNISAPRGHLPRELCWGLVGMPLGFGFSSLMSRLVECNL